MSTAPATTALELHAGPLRLALRPDIGGAIAGLWHGQTPVLRSMPPEALTDGHDAGSFPLVPYSNRIAHRRFAWRGEAHTTEPNFPGPHSIHGIGWQRPWRVVAQDAASATLQLSHRPDADWPFAFDSQQRFTLTPRELRMELAITNTDTAPQPAGLGWHPYFIKRAQSHLRAQLTHRWINDEIMLPLRRDAVAGIDAPIAALDLDNCHEGWQPPARIDDECLRLAIDSDLPYLVVYAVPDKPIYCVEPVSQVNDAIHHSDPASQGLRTLAPGEQWTAWMTLTIETP